MVKTNEVYGVSNEMIETYIEREKVDTLFVEGLQKNKHIIIYGASKQGKTSLTNKHLKEGDYVKVNCSPQMTTLSIYSSIVRQLDIEVLDYRETAEKTGDDVSIGLKAILHIPILGGESHAATSTTKENVTSQKFRTIEYNLALAQDLSELLKKVNFSKRIILENFHYLQETVQKQLSTDLRIFEDYNILFIILGIWRERNRLTQFNGDLVDRIVEVPVEPWEKEELKKIVKVGMPLLNVSFENVVDHIIESCFDSVGVFQEICKESCYFAGINETSDKLVEINLDNVQKAIEKKKDDYSSRHIRSLESFIGQTSRSLDEIPLYIPYYFIKILFSEPFEEITDGITRKNLHDKIMSIHHRPADVRSSDMGYFLTTVVASQIKKGISPPIFDYDAGTKKIKIIDSTFYFFLKNSNAEEILDMLPIPSGVTDIS